MLLYWISVLLLFCSSPEAADWVPKAITIILIFKYELDMGFILQLWKQGIMFDIVDWDFPSLQHSLKFGQNSYFVKHHK